MKKMTGKMKAIVSLIITTIVTFFLWRVIDAKNIPKNLEPIIIVIIIIIGLSIAWYYYFTDKIVEENKKQEERILKRKTKYSYYISIVDSIVKDELSKIDDSMVERFKVRTKEDMDYLEWISINQMTICGKVYPLNSFIEASCLMYALIYKTRVDFTIPKGEENVPDELTFINSRIALNSALKVIEKPITRRKDSFLEIGGEANPSANIFIPKGIDPNNTLYDAIIKILNIDIHTDYSKILQFANMLHLIYLYSLK